MIIVTTNELPGYRIEHVFGECFGLTVRSRHIGSNIGAGLKSLAGGELKGITQLLHECRQEALSRLSEEAQGRGANAVVAFRFETTEYAGGGGVEVCAYGTAVGVRPVDGPHAAQQHAPQGQQFAPGQPAPQQ
ncbi:UPF0145 protein [Gordonia spumicola]|uniref:UPF0145 protein nbrc107696_40640 n=1 Tax=Gordonia spumicola TaxID=589161 RepID=A0A7I9VE45_9ACTN|nr:YbjQ family protein [Gordonia spumicola]GEE03618.1 UPF0145 protein [Gordonia spumicola]